MLRQVRVEEPGNSTFLVGEEVARVRIKAENAKLINQGLQPVRSKPKLLGITKASLSTDSFISAASFQETTKILTDAALEGKMDTFRGLKENVILGRLIPAGTGFSEFRGLAYELNGAIDPEALKRATEAKAAAQVALEAKAARAKAAEAARKEAEAARTAEAKAVVEMVVADPGAVETTAETV
jgi:DNA-directed RNA polymerase subunit beta'